MRKHKETVIPLTIIALGCAFMVLGAYRGELKTLFAKAIEICLECIGIG